MEGLISNIEIAIPMSQIIILLIISIGFVVFGQFYFYLLLDVSK